MHLLIHCFTQNSCPLIHFLCCCCCCHFSPPVSCFFINFLCRSASSWNWVAFLCLSFFAHLAPLLCSFFSLSFHHKEWVTDMSLSLFSTCSSSLSRYPILLWPLMGCFFAFFFHLHSFSSSRSSSSSSYILILKPYSPFNLLSLVCLLILWSHITRIISFSFSLRKHFLLLLFSCD